MNTFVNDYGESADSPFLLDTEVIDVKKFVSMWILLVATLLMAVSMSAIAKEKPEWRSWPMGDRMSGSIGYYKPKLNTEAAIATQGEELGAYISFEDTLGLSDSKGTAIVGLKWRISKRNELSFNYFKLDRSSGKNVELQVFVEGTDCDPNCSVELPISSVFNIESVDITYAFSAVFREKHNLAFGIGLSLQNLQFGFRPSENCDDEIGPDLCSLVEPKEAKATAPLPTFKAVYQYAINDKWIVDTNIGYFGLDLTVDDEKGEDIGGQIWNASADIQWKTWKNVGFSLGYKFFDVDLDYERSGTIPYKAAANYDYRGFVLGLDGYF